jgi:hypothetical protein
MRMLIMAVQMKCVPQIDTRQNAENIGLNECDTEFEDMIATVNAKGNHPINRPPPDRQAEQHGKQHMASRHIGK